MFYLDNAATTWPKPEIVYQTLDESFRQLFSPKRGTATASRLGGQKLLEARETLAGLFHIQNPHRVCFTPGCTYALNFAIQAFPWEPGDTAIISAVEHHALSRPIRKMARERGVQFQVVPYQHNAPFDLNHYEHLLKTEKHVRMVATTHASNVIGCVLPIREIGHLAHEYGAWYLVDAAQTAGMLPIDVLADNIDMLAVPGHKSLYGPPGVGALYLSKKVPLCPLIEGGTGNDSGQHPMSASVPDSFEAGTIPLPSILALAAGARWVQQIGLETIHRHEMSLLKQLMEGLSSVEGIHCYGPQDLQIKVPVLSFNMQGIAPKILGEHLFDESGIALRAGFHCAPMAHEAIETITSGGTVRASIGYFTTAADIEALLHSCRTTAMQGITVPQGVS